MQVLGEPGGFFRQVHKAILDGARNRVQAHDLIDTAAKRGGFLLVLPPEAIFSDGVADMLQHRQRFAFWVESFTTARFTVRVPKTDRISSLNPYRLFEGKRTPPR
jgi:hypothetical protein